MLDDVGAVLNVACDLNHIFHPLRDPLSSDEHPSLGNRVAAVAFLIFSLLSLGIVTAFYLYHAHRKVQWIDRLADEKGESKFFHECHNVDLVRRMLDKGADIEAVNQGKTPLLKSENKHVTRMLIERGADIHARDARGNTKLHLEVNKRNPEIEILELLVSKGADINAQNQDLETPLHRAGSRMAVEFLLNHGANTEIKDYKGTTPLVRREMRGAEDLLVDRGADINARTPEGWTILHTTDNMALVECLVSEKEMDVDIRTSEEGNTPLLFTSDIKKAFLLIVLGADVKAVNNKQETVLHLGYLGSSYLAPDYSILRVYCEKGGNINAQDDEGNTPLHKCRSLEEAKALISKGADPRIPNNAGQTPYFAAQNKEVAAFFAGQRFPLPFDNQGRNPLHICNFGMIDYWVDVLGPNSLNHQDNEGNTPLHTSSAIQALLKKGADRNIENNAGEKPKIPEGLI